MSCDVRDLLYNGDLLDHIRFEVYAMLEDDTFVLAHNHTHDVFHLFLCPDTQSEFEWCYHTVGMCMELRDVAQTFRIVFRYVQDEVEDFGEVVHRRYTIIDRVDGDHVAICRYFTLLKLASR